MLLRMKRFSDTGKLLDKENVLKGDTVSTKGSNRHERNVPKPLQSNAIKNAQIIDIKAPQDIGCSTKFFQSKIILKRKCPEVTNSVASLNKNLKECNLPNAYKKPQER